MPDPPIQIVRYPNRRLYDRQASKYVSLQEIEALVQSGQNVQIRDSQTNEDLTRSILTRIIMERQPEKMLLFPPDMLHFILRSNDVMAGFLRDYFQHSLTYLAYLQRHRPTASSLAQPVHWVKAWLDAIGASPPKSPPAADQVDASESAGLDEQLAQRVQQLEERIRQLESKEG